LGKKRKKEPKTKRVRRGTGHKNVGKGYSVLQGGERKATQWKSRKRGGDVELVREKGGESGSLFTRNSHYKRKKNITKMQTTNKSL